MKENKLNSRERRRHIRVEYPASSSPKLIIGEYEYRIMDISERGVKFVTEYPDRFHPELTEVQGNIVFSDGSTCEIQGAIIRIERTQFSPETRIAIFLYDNSGIPPSLISRELAKINAL
ncbi:MAG: PilZ domain-containing protein [Candidatus Auribacterota bacterium]|nr:PilZ domain-containing protein [Candidatus Auribacterota bacterium]